MSPAKLSVLISILLAAVVFAGAQSDKTTGGFKCSGSTTKCTGMVGYVLRNTTTLSALQSQFNVSSFRSLLSVNPQFPVSTTKADHKVAANSTVKIPFPCACSGGYGISDKIPVYTVVPQDGLAHIAVDVYGGLATYQQIGAVNNIQDLNKILVGQEIHIPLPCSCDDVDGEKVVHYGHLVQAGSNISSIAKEFGASEDTLMKLNGLSDPKQLKAYQVLDVPIPACTSVVNSTSLDYPLLLAKGTYSLTANDCIMCQCNSTTSTKVQCEASGLKPSKWTTCPSVQCSGGQLLSNTTSSTCSNSTCSYAGYTKDQILTTLDVENTCIAPNATTPSENGSNSLCHHGSLAIVLLCVQLYIILLQHH